MSNKHSVLSRKEQLKELDRKDKIERQYLEKRYSTKTEEVIYERRVNNRYRTKTKDNLIRVSTYQSSSNHKIVQISQLYFDFYDCEYKNTKKNISVPIKDFKKMIKELNDSI
jgi:hypothetical protein